MRKLLPVFLSCLLILLFSKLEISAQQLPSTKDSLFSKSIGELRKIQVILPKDYKTKTDTKYEVLYILDGEWYIEQTPFIYNFVVSAGYAPENIFVLLPNTYRNGTNLRDRDYSPSKIAEDSISGGADNYHAFLKDELIPYVESKYRVNGKRSLIGSSFSGLFAIYAFLKDPGLFESFIASDPNVRYDNHYVTKLAAEKVPGFTNVTSTLFFAGLETTSKFMGSKGMDSVLRAKAPANLHWKFVEYKDETHYSVQHKAFYDGMRYAHLGFSKNPIGFHPMNGILEKGKPLLLIAMNQGTEVRYTTDGSTPVTTSPLLQHMITVLTEPTTFKAKTFPNRAADVQEITGKFAAGSFQPIKGKAKPLTYKLYDGKWTAIPDFKKLKPAKSGNITKDFNVAQVKGKDDAAYVIDGALEIDQDGYYIFATTGGDAGKITLSGRTLIDTNLTKVPGIKSYVVPLKKGAYPFHAEFLQKHESMNIVLFINRSTAENSDWGENSFIRLMY